MHTPRMNYRQATSLNEAVISAVTGKPLSEDQNSSDKMKYNGTLEAINNFIESGTGNPGTLELDRMDFNGDGVIDAADAAIVQQILDDGTLPFMGQPIAANYRKYMASDARSGRKQSGGAQLDIGTTKGSMTSRPPAAPPATGTSAK